MKILIAVSLVYGGLLVMLVGAVAVVRPLRLPALRSRATGVLVLFCGVLIFINGGHLADRGDAGRNCTDETR